VDRPSGPEIAALLRRADELIAAGDIVSARRFFERAAEGGDAAAACGIAKSYDPLFLRQAGVRGVAGDPGRAANWYRSAIAAGSSEAELRLKRLQLAYPP